MPFVEPAPTPVVPAAPRPPRDVIAVTKTLGDLDRAVAAFEQATKIPVPSKGPFGSGDAYDAAVAKRRELLEPAAATIKGATELLTANAGYRGQASDGFGYPKDPSGYRVPVIALGDNGHDIVSISDRAAKNPVAYKWGNDFPWQSQPKTTLADMVELVREQAGEVTRGEARISLRRVTDLTSSLLYERRADQLDTLELQRLQDAVVAVRSLGDSRFVDDKLRGQLAVLPSQVLVDGKLTTDPDSLAALEQLHRATVVDTGSATANANVAAQLAKAQELAQAGDTAAARAIYDQLADAGAVAA